MPTADVPHAYVAGAIMAAGAAESGQMVGPESAVHAPDPSSNEAIGASVSAGVHASDRARPMTGPRRGAIGAPHCPPHLVPFAHALADLLLADLLKYPPES
jgi:hypothetical protein